MSKLLNIPSSSSDNILVMANYTKLSESIRRLTPQGIQCSVFCGGINCKYENPESWTTDSLAIQGIYSHWITDDILAMARPSTTVIIRKHIIEQFRSLGIKSIINLQSPKEHASCGELLEDSGFSYDPNIFMENDIYYYNFAWKDYGDATLSELLNSVKVLTFAVTEGRVAVHCHAGLGRTGVLIACYLVYSLRVTANDAIKYVRFKRPGSVQTRGQIICVRHFAQFVLPQSITFYIKDSKDKYMTEFDLKKFLKRQRIVLHGYDERKFKYLPKIIHIICERLLELCGCYTEEFVIDHSSITYNFLCTKVHNSVQDNICHNSNIDDLPSNTELVTISTCESTCSNSVSPGSSECDVLEDNVIKMGDSCSDLSTLDRDEVHKELLLDENKCHRELQKRKELDEIIPPKEIFTSANIIDSLLKPIDSKDSVVAKTLLQFEEDINISPLGWSKLKIETDTTTLTGLLFAWLESLKNPVFGQEHLEIIVICFNDAKRCLQKFELEEACLVEYLLNFVTKLFPLSENDIDNILMRFIASLTQQSVVINSVLLPLNKDFQKLRDGTLRCTLQFFKSLLSLICNHRQQNKVLKT